MGRTDAVQFTLEVVKRARDLGATVTFQSGWESRGNGTSANYEGAVVHHTASASSSTRTNPTLGLLINGRSDLPGPLCNVTGPWCSLESPTLHVVAAHPANHAGASGGRSMGPLPVTGLFNPRVYGLEIDYAGSSPMSAGQRLAALIFSRAVVDVLKRSTEYVRAHAETSITGKWDPGQSGGVTIDMAAFRRDAAAVRAANVEDIIKIAGGNVQLAKVVGTSGPISIITDDELVDSNNIGLVGSLAKVHGVVVQDRTREEIQEIRQYLAGRKAARDADVARIVAASTPGVDVDEAALAAQLGPLLVPHLSTTLPGLTDADVTRLARAAADEEDRRERERLG